MLLLAWALSLGPQLSLMHALSHLASPQAASAVADDQQAGPDKVCDTCLALAQLGAALPSASRWHGGEQVAATPPQTQPQGIAPLPVAAFLARGPPLPLI